MASCRTARHLLKTVQRALNRTLTARHSSSTTSGGVEDGIGGSLHSLPLQRDYITNAEGNGPPRVLITGGLGQLGSGLAKVLRHRYGEENVVLSDIVRPTTSILNEGPYVYADVLDGQNLNSIVVNYNIDWIVHFSALLSAVGEKNFRRALQVNITGFHNIIEVCQLHNLRLFCPSTIGAFGASSPKNPCPDVTIQRPETIYGVSKVHVELLGEYFHHKYGVDFRSLRFPGILSADTVPGGGTTDYAVHIFHDVINTGRYKCFLREDTRLPMMYLADCIKATILCLEAPSSAFTDETRTYNVQAVSFTPGELVTEMRKYFPDMEVTYEPDERQAIADSWPQVLEDRYARENLGWSPDYDLERIVKDMVKVIKGKRT